MIDFYKLLGTINTVFIFVSLIGVYSQIRTIQSRKKDVTKLQSTELLSLNQFTVSFLAYFSFFIYGYSISPFNHFIVWPRLIASLLVLKILFEIWHDRKTKASKIIFFLAACLLAVGIAGLFIGNSYTDEGKKISASLIVLITIFLAQGYFHQIMLIWRSGRTDAVDLKMSQFILAMDISTILFALSMKMNNGWPLLVLAVTSAITKIIIIYLFHWVKTSDTAKKRNMLNNINKITS